MASTTPNIGLTLPTGAEKVSRQIINDNNTLIDGKMGAVPVGQNLQGEIDALNGNIININNSLNVNTLSASSLNELKTSLNTLANSMENDEVRHIRVAPTFTESGFISGTTCKGWIFGIYKNPSNVMTYFTGTLISNLGDMVNFGYSGGTWHFKAVTAT